MTPEEIRAAVRGAVHRVAVDAAGGTHVAAFELGLWMGATQSQWGIYYVAGSGMTDKQAALLEDAVAALVRAVPL